MTNLDTAAIRRKPVLNGLINAQAASRPYEPQVTCLIVFRAAQVD